MLRKIYSNVRIEEINPNAFITFNVFNWRYQIGDERMVRSRIFAASLNVFQQGLEIGNFNFKLLS